MADYKLKFTAAEIDEKLSSISNKQDKLIGTQGQVVGFDVDGNAVAQEAPEAVTSWNDLTDKPFGETATGGDTIYMPDNLSGLESVNSTNGLVYKISNITPTSTDLESGGFIKTSNGLEDFYSILESTDKYVILGSYQAYTYVYIIYENNASTSCGVFPNIGMYAHSDDAYVLGFESLTINGFTSFPDIKKLDSKYLDFNIDDYKNAILLDGQTLKDVSGEDITEDIKAVVAPTITGNVGDFVVIGEDGKLTAKTIVAAEGVSF